MHSYIKLMALAITSSITMQGAQRFKLADLHHPLAPATQQELHSIAHKKSAAAATAQHKIQADIIETRRKKRTAAIAKILAKTKSKEFLAAVQRGQLISVIMPDNYEKLTVYTACIQEKNRTDLYTILGIDNWAIFKKFCKTAESMPGTMQRLAQEYPGIVQYQGIAFYSSKK